jgi:hypothetical protein
MFYFLHKYRIATTIMHLDALEPIYDIYIDTNYATRYSYLCNVVHCVKFAYCSLVDASPCSRVKTFSFERKKQQL